MTLKQDFCLQFSGECATQLGLPADYCEVHAGPEGDQYWSYPLVIDGTYACMLRNYCCPTVVGSGLFAAAT